MVSTQLKNISQNGSFPQVGVKIKNLWNHHLVNLSRMKTDERCFRSLSRQISCHRLRISAYRHWSSPGFFTATLGRLSESDPVTIPRFKATVPATFLVPFGVTSAEVAINCLEKCLINNPTVHPFNRWTCEENILESATLFRMFFFSRLLLFQMNWNKTNT